ncbi:MAG: xanthine dehydrogenase small subunit [Betaproteobacteria bacterium]|nr:xanthine dehydrogenase small subunit [Betaproteobacteria bacterium]
MAEALRLLLNGEEVAVAGLSPQTTLLEYLRERRRLTGTKEGCAEGDCGACTVIVAEPGDDGTLAWQPVNACIRLLPSLDGKAVFTVESLRLPDGGLHPVQEALVREHGAQCGFCTPGFVMSLFGLYKRAVPPSRADAEVALSGNLCRCTGYRPILAAAQTMTMLAPPDGWRGPGADAAGGRQVSAEERALALRLRRLARAGDVTYRHGAQTCHAPATLEALARCVADHPDARLLAGGTDLALRVTKQQQPLGDLIHTGRVAELQAIRRDDGGCSIGAAASLERAFAALDVDWPELRETWERFASVPIRRAGTLGGNVANASPIGDSMPALIALGAQIELRRGAATRRLALEDFYLAHPRTALQPGEFLVRILVPARAAGTVLRAYKLSRRHDQDIAAVALALRLDLDGARIVRARIGCGGVAATPRRAVAAERALAGRDWNQAAAQAAMDAIGAEFAPITDHRATADYRRRALERLVWRFWLQTDPARRGDLPLRVQDVTA